MSHTPPPAFRPGAAVALEFALPDGAARAARLWYRRVDQSARWRSAELAAQGRAWRGSIPAAYTDSPYPLQYYVALTDAAGRAWLWPGFAGSLDNEPYVVLRRRG